MASNKTTAKAVRKPSDIFFMSGPPGKKSYRLIPRDFPRREPATNNMRWVGNTRRMFGSKNGQAVSRCQEALFPRRGCEGIGKGRGARLPRNTFHRGTHAAALALSPHALTVALRILRKYAELPGNSCILGE